ncbi:hypothetical protein IVA98_32985 [Bradyrhizobium sp. 160]|uniref:hypothetical protein n=1 Tax=unclassified Bradyrhizobium TaxID=2631580 RepID=UPI001FFB401E|nr:MULTISPECIES: hypothetical protein [unclassified Bradyrhizobium]MCK1542217.1 hypothetical protein [Bradyrhizobium sp. 179]MCK1627845.1 hypothetical protein [Bradyrhizobium sp. 160]
MSNLSQFPQAGQRALWDKHQAESFRAMEGPLLDCVRMAGISARLMSDVADDTFDEQLAFAVYHTREMLEALLSTYLAGYKEGRIT